MAPIDAPVDPTRATKTAAEILFVVCFVFVLSIYLLNSSLARQRDLQSARSSRQAALTKMVERLRSFRAKDADFYERLAMASIEIAYHTGEYEDRYPTLVRSNPTVANSRTFLEMPSQKSSALRAAAEKFGKATSKVNLAQLSPDGRRSEFRKLITSAYKNDPEAARFLDTEVVPRLVEIASPAEWDKIAWWIATDEWPSPGGLYIGPGVGVTFETRILDPANDHAERFYVYDLMRFTPDLASAEQALTILWQQSYLERRATSTTSPGVSLPTLGLSVSADAIVAGAAPILLLFQLIFLVHWERQSVADRDTEAFAFPSYACPNDPLSGPIPKTLGETVQRFVWMLFLILPTLLFSLGVLTRYDLLYPLGYFNGGDAMTLFKAEMWARSQDRVSSVVDWVTLACISLSTLALLSITRQVATTNIQSKIGHAITIGGWIVAVGTAFACVLATLRTFTALVTPLANSSSSHFNMGYLAAFGVLHSLSLGVACQRRSRLVGLLSVAGLAVFALHFVSF